jgi:hypothetical protein
MAGGRVCVHASQSGNRRERLASNTNALASLCRRPSPPPSQLVALPISSVPIIAYHSGHRRSHLYHRAINSSPLRFRPSDPFSFHSSPYGRPKPSLCSAARTGPLKPALAKTPPFLSFHFISQPCQSPVVAQHRGCLLARPHSRSVSPLSNAKLPSQGPQASPVGQHRP